MSGRVPRLAAALVVAACIFSAGSARADGRAELDKARAAYVARNYADAEQRLRALVDPRTGLKERPLLSLARMNLGAVLVAQGRKEQAGDVFEKLMLEDPAFEPDPLSFPGDVINQFIDVRAQLQERLKSAAQTAAKLEAERKAREEAEREKQRIWFERVKKQAMEEKITVRHSRVVASLPFGAGQFHNDNPVLGWIFLGTQAAAVVGSAVTFGMYLYANSREKEEIGKQDPEGKAEQYHDRSVILFQTNLAFAGAFAALAGVGILQAHLAFVPETHETKPRELPPLSKITPFVAPTQNGAVIGIQAAMF